MVIRHAASADLTEIILHREDLFYMYLAHDDDAKHIHCKYCCLAVSDNALVSVLSMAQLTTTESY